MEATTTNLVEQEIARVRAQATAELREVIARNGQNASTPMSKTDLANTLANVEGCVYFLAETAIREAASAEEYRACAKDAEAALRRIYETAENWAQA